MQTTEESLNAGALALSFKYCGLSQLRRAYAKLQADGNGAKLTDALREAGELPPEWAEKLDRSAALARQLRLDAVYGTVAMRNRLVGGKLLNACMEESRRSGYAKTLSEILLERGVLSPTLDQAIANRQQDVLAELRSKEDAIAATIDLERDSPETVELKLAMLLGEVAAKISFLGRPDFELALRNQLRAEQGLPPEELEAPAPEPEPTPVRALTQRDAPPSARASAPASTPASAPSASTGPTQQDLMPPRPAAAPAPGGDSPIKGYELLEKLGSGAMGAVLRALKTDTGEIVALKILKPELSNDREYVERFLREAKAVARLSHPHIIRAVQVGRSGEYYFFAMEFVEGQTTSDLLKAKGPLAEQFAVRVIRCIASALAHAWQHQIIHRDIKPDNIMVTADGDVKLTDLGLARTAKQDSTLTITGVVMGSPAYISPEQATGEKNLDMRSDIYSLGATLYHLLVGAVPYDGETPLHVMLKHMNDPLPDVRSGMPTVSEATRQLVFRMMAKRPEGRFQSAQEVEAAARAIEEALARGQTPPIPQAAGGSGVRSPQPQPRPQGQPPRPQPRPVAATVASPTAAAGSRSGVKAAAGGLRSSGVRKSGLKKKEEGKKGDPKKKEVGERLKRMKKKRRF